MGGYVHHPQGRELRLNSDPFVLGCSVTAFKLCRQDAGRQVPLTPGSSRAAAQVRGPGGNTTPLPSLPAWAAFMPWTLNPGVSVWGRTRGLGLELGCRAGWWGVRSGDRRRALDLGALPGDGGEAGCAAIIRGVAPALQTQPCRAAPGPHLCRELGVYLQRLLTLEWDLLGKEGSLAGHW